MTSSFLKYFILFFVCRRINRNSTLFSIQPEKLSANSPLKVDSLQRGPTTNNSKTLPTSYNNNNNDDNNNNNNNNNSTKEDANYSNISITSSERVRNKEERVTLAIPSAIAPKLENGVPISAFSFPSPNIENKPSRKTRKLKEKHAVALSHNDANVVLEYTSGQTVSHFLKESIEKMKVLLKMMEKNKTCLQLDDQIFYGESILSEESSILGYFQSSNIPIFSLQIHKKPKKTQTTEKIQNLGKLQTSEKSKSSPLNPSPIKSSPIKTPTVGSPNFSSSSPSPSPLFPSPKMENFSNQIQLEKIEFPPLSSSLPPLSYFSSTPSTNKSIESALSPSSSSSSLSSPTKTNLKNCENSARREMNGSENSARRESYARKNTSVVSAKEVKNVLESKKVSEKVVIEVALPDETHSIIYLNSEATVQKLISKCCLKRGWSPSDFVLLNSCDNSLIPNSLSLLLPLLLLPFLLFFSLRLLSWRRNAVVIV